MHSGSADVPPSKVLPILEPLFERAKATDEFEYACTLLRIRGMEAEGWDPVIESQALISDAFTIIEKTKLEGAPLLRLGLLVYCHLTEMSMPYHVIANMLRVCKGQRYVMFPFESKPPARYPATKIKRIKDWAAELNLLEVSSLFDSFFSKEIRNAFFHSDYVIHGDRFNITKGSGMLVDHVITPSVPINSHVLPKINDAVHFILDFFDLLERCIRSYKEPKILQGRILAGDRYAEIELTVDPRFGLNGFRSPPRRS